MRPRTIAEACQRAKEGEAWDRTMGNFLQAFYTAPAEHRSAMLQDEPPKMDDERLDALVGGIGEYLFKRWAPEKAPCWIGNRDRYLKEPWFPGVGDDPGLREFMTFSSPPEFKSRNIMTEAEPLRRAVTPRPCG